MLPASKHVTLYSHTLGFFFSGANWKHIFQLFSIPVWAQCSFLPMQEVQQGHWSVTRRHWGTGEWERLSQEAVRQTSSSDNSTGSFSWSSLSHHCWWVLEKMTVMQHCVLGVSFLLNRSTKHFGTSSITRHVSKECGHRASSSWRRRICRGWTSFQLTSTPG